MLKSTPNILFNLEYNLYYQPNSGPKYGFDRRKNMATDLKKRSGFVRCKDTEYNLAMYLDRLEATDKYDIETIKMIEAAAEYTDINKGDIIGYAAKRPGSTGLFNAEGSLDKEQKKVLIEELRQTKSIVWTGILSFEENYGNKFCRNKKDAHELITSTLKNLFKKSHLKYENIDWFAAMHTNTDNRHIHLAFWEKEPLSTKKNAEGMQYSTFGAISKEAIDDFKFSVANHFEYNKVNFATTRDSIRNQLKTSLKEGVEHVREFKEIQNSIVQSGTFLYGKLPIILQKRIRMFSNSLIENSPQLKQEKKKYMEELINTQKKYLDTCRVNNIQPTNAIKNFVNSRIEELYNKLGNDICKTAKEFARKHNMDSKNISKQHNNKIFSPIIDNALQKKRQLFNVPRSKTAIKAASIAYKQSNHLLLNSIRSLGAAFTKNFNVCYSAVLEQEHRKRLAEQNQQN